MRQPIARAAERRSAPVACATRQAGRFFANHAGRHGTATNSHLPAHRREPSPSAAAVLGLIPGVGAMYNGQFIKGLVHVVIFAVLVSAAHVYGVFGIFIAAWMVYQSFEAYHTAKARRDGMPLPDPLGLNEVGNWINPGLGDRIRGRRAGPAGQALGQPQAQGRPPAAINRLISRRRIRHRIRSVSGAISAPPLSPARSAADSARFHRCRQLDGGARSRLGRLC